MSQAAFELDHVFVMTGPGAPEAELLIELGLSEGTPNRHPGQGTACRRFFFANAYLELVWVENDADAGGPPAARTRLLDRFLSRGAGACPFGIALRPGSGPTPPDDMLPFGSWEYRPPYLPPGLAIHVATNSDHIGEPMLFYLPFGRRPDSPGAPQPQSREHSAGMRSLTRLVLHLPVAAGPSPELASLTSRGLVELRQGTPQLLELEFDRGVNDRRIELNPHLPIAFSW